MSHKFAYPLSGSGFYSFFLSQKKQELFQQNNFYEKNLIQMINYLEKLLQVKYPCYSTKLVFVPNLFISKARKQSLDFAGGLHIFDEELLFRKNQLENRYSTYKNIAMSISFDYFGNKVYEESADDQFLIVGIRESIGNHFKILKCGVLLYRYHIMKTIEDVYKKMKLGVERYPLSSVGQQQNQLSWSFLN